MAESNDQVAIGKFDILATYTFGNAPLDGLSDGEAKGRGIVAAVMGAQARFGVRRKQEDDHKAQKEAAEKKRKTTITASSFGHQVKDEMGDLRRYSAGDEKSCVGGSFLRGSQAGCRYLLNPGHRSQQAVPRTSRLGPQEEQGKLSRPASEPVDAVRFNPSLRRGFCCEREHDVGSLGSRRFGR